MTDLIKGWRRAVAERLRAWAGRVDPGWPLPAQYTAGHVLRYHDLLIDIGIADAYDQMVGGDGAPAQPDTGATGQPQAAPPSGVREDANTKQAAEVMHGQRQGAESGISAQEAQVIRRAMAGEIERLNLIILDISEEQAADVPIDVTIQALRHFVPVYAAAMSALTGTAGDTA